MGDITSDCTIRYGADVAGFSEIVIETPDTADTADTIAFDLDDYGITNFLTIDGYVHTTTDSVIVKEEPTTAVTSGELEITVGGSTVSNKKRVYVVKGRGAK
jgi:hypothetical protein